MGLLINTLSQLLLLAYRWESSLLLAAPILISKWGESMPTDPNIPAYIMGIAALLTTIFSFVQGMRSNKNKPQVDQSQSKLNEASAAETIGKAWDVLYDNATKEIEKLQVRERERDARDAERDEIIRRQGETLNALMRTMDKVTEENNSLKADNLQLRNENAQLKVDNTLFKQRIEDQSIEIQDLRTELEAVKEKQQNV